MKKLLTTLTLGLTLASGVFEAHATFLTDWTYSLNSITVDRVNTDLVSTTTDGHYTWEGGKYTNTIDLADGFTGDFSFNTHDGKLEGQNVLEQFTSKERETGVNDSFGNQALFELVFDLSLVSDGYDPSLPGGNGVNFDLTYRIPFYTYYDSANGQEFVYYDTTQAGYYSYDANGDKLFQATTKGFGEDYYHVSEIGLSVDGRVLTNSSANGGDQVGWLINEDTRNNNYSQYYLTTPDGSPVDNSVFFESAKGTAGLFDINGAITVTHTGDTAPTPEPATMLLTGLGLAGLGAIKRRRNKVQ